MSRAATLAPTQERRFTHDLIESDKVVGTNVYRSNGEKIGTIERLMIDKFSGQVAYAVMSFGGFLGLGHEHYPVPWPRLDYEKKHKGFVVNISDDELKNAPKFDPGEEWDWADTKRGETIYGYYRVPPYWI
jgi:sporulation protein YlmC with PRC-barrel domain